MGIVPPDPILYDMASHPARERDNFLFDTGKVFLMDFQNVGDWLPKALYIVCAVGVVYLLLRFKRRNDLAVWFKILREHSAKANDDDNFRIRELRRAEADLAENPLPDSVEPMKRNHEYYVHAVPKLLFITGLGGVIILYLGLFKPESEPGSNWMIVVGPLLLLAVGAAILATAGMRRNYGHVQRLNRLYIMQKAGKDVDASLKTMENIMKFYPVVPELWLERADMLVKLGRLDEGLKAIHKSRELSPADMDLAVIEVSYYFRKNDLASAAPIVESLAGMRKAETDPRPNIYAAALALKRNDKKSAKDEAEWALKLDTAFTKRFLSRDETLAGLAEFMKENRLVEDEPKDEGQ